jgi:hypothetical protein
MRNAFILVGLIGASNVVGCGSDGSGGAGLGDAGGTGASSGNGGASTGTGGGIGKATGGNGVGAGPNQYPSGKPVSSCFGNCPLGECDNDGFWSDTPCTSVYRAPVDQSSSYCGATDGSYCLQLSFGDQYGVQCASGKTTIHQCTTGCGSVGAGAHECD